MAADSPDLYLRMRELGLDPSIRVGRLTYVCRITGRKGRLIGVMFLCDCGRFCKSGLSTVYKWAENGEELPWECDTCRLQTKRMKAGHKIRAQKIQTRTRYNKKRKLYQRKRAIEKKQKAGIPIRGRLKKDFPSEFHAWCNINTTRKEPAPRWWKTKRGFENFLKDVGLKPHPEARLMRRDRTLPHSKENTYWLLPKQK